MKYPRLILAGTHSGVGKTTLALGIMLALKKRGLTVAPFKIGPDYIDGSYHAEITGGKSHNLDSWLLSRGAVLELFAQRAKNADFSVIEGVMGLYDGREDSQAGSTAQIAKLLDCPVILVVNAKSFARGAAAMVLGYKKFDTQVNLCAVILNNIASPKHFALVKKAIEATVKIPVLGYLPKNLKIGLAERHLGLVPAKEKKLPGDFLRKLLYLTQKNIDINKIIKLGRASPKLAAFKKTIFVNHQKTISRLNIAVAFDQAFNFYYQDNLNILKHLGAHILFFSPLKNQRLPKNIHGLYIGGGYPELFARPLSKNTSLKKDIYTMADNGLPIYAECAGLMYLTQGIIDFKKINYPMVGIFKAVTAMSNRLQTLGYVNIHTINNNILSWPNERIRAHLFHWSYLKKISDNLIYAYKVEKNGYKTFYDGLINKNVLASYAHLHFASNLNFPKRFIQACREYKNANS